MGTKQERIEMRLSPWEKQEIERWATDQRESLSDFLRTAASERIKRLRLDQAAGPVVEP